MNPEDLFPVEVWTQILTELVVGASHRTLRSFANACSMFHSLAASAIAARVQLCGEEEKPLRGRPTPLAVLMGAKVSGKLVLTRSAILKWIRKHGMAFRRWLVILDANAELEFLSGGLFRKAIARNDRELVVAICSALGDRLVGIDSWALAAAASVGWIEFLASRLMPETRVEDFGAEATRLGPVVNFARDIDTIRWFARNGLVGGATCRALFRVALKDDPEELEEAWTALGLSSSTNNERGRDDLFRLINRTLQRGCRRSFRWLDKRDKRNYFSASYVNSAIRGRCFDELHPVPGMVPLPQVETRYVEPHVCESYFRFWVAHFNCLKRHPNRSSFEDSLLKMIVSSGTAEQFDFFLDQDAKERKEYRGRVVWKIIASSRKMTDLTIVRHAYKKFPNDLFGQFAGSKFAYFQWRTFLENSPVEVLKEVWKVTLESNAALKNGFSWLIVLAKRSPNTSANSKRDAPPLEPILDWILQIRPDAVKKEGKAALRCCSQSNNKVVMNWLFQHGLLDPKQESEPSFHPLPSRWHLLCLGGEEAYFLATFQ